MQRVDQSPGHSDSDVTAGSNATLVTDPIDPTPHDSILGDLVNVVRGFCMGAADTVPGVSGGTVALILGHYSRLVTAIAHVDGTLFGLAKDKQYAAAARHLDLRFLISLGIGIVIGIGTLSGLMHWLLAFRMPQTLAVFFGLLVASVWIVKGYVDHWTAGRIASLLFGAAVAVGITLLPMGTGTMTLPYLFFSATIAICAMILPGISGAFVLLLLGVYHGVTGLIKDAVKGNFSAESLTQIAVFVTGCGVGLLTFSRLLRYLLEHHRGTTMAWLMGLMIGSVGKLWPLQRPTLETQSLELKYRVMQYVSPTDWNGSLSVLAGLAVAAAVAVIAIEKFADSNAANSDAANSDMGDSNTPQT